MPPNCHLVAVYPWARESYLISLNLNFLSKETGFGTEWHLQVIEVGINIDISINISVGVGISAHSHKRLFCHKHSYWVLALWSLFWWEQGLEANKAIHKYHTSYSFPFPQPPAPQQGHMGDLEMLLPCLQEETSFKFKYHLRQWSKNLTRNPVHRSVFKQLLGRLKCPFMDFCGWSPVGTKYQNAMQLCNFIQVYKSQNPERRDQKNSQIC